MSGSLRLAVIPGDGIGPEVTAEARKVLDAAAAAEGITVTASEFDLGASRYLRTGELLPAPVLEQLRGFDAILLGAIGHPDVPSGVLERGLLLALRSTFDHAVNLRPLRRFGPGEPLDVLVVREGTEGPYVGAGGRLRRGTPHEVAVEESLNTAYGVDRVVRYAFARAAVRPRRRLTLVHKTNVLVHAGSLWAETVQRVAGEYPDVEWEYVHVDAAAMYLVQAPNRFDVIVTDNLFGDILTDLGAAVAGGIGRAASANLNLDGSAPGMFEPVHGSAPDIAGRGTADPTAAILSAALLLETLGQDKAARRIEDAVTAREHAATGAAAPTTAVGDELAALAGG